MIRRDERERKGRERQRETKRHVFRLWMGRNSIEANCAPASKHISDIGDDEILSTISVTIFFMLILDCIMCACVSLSLCVLCLCKLYLI